MAIVLLKATTINDKLWAGLKSSVYFGVCVFTLVLSDRFHTFMHHCIIHVLTRTIKGL